MFDQSLLPLVENLVRKALVLSAFKGSCSKVTEKSLRKRGIVAVTWCPTGTAATITIELTDDELQPTVIFTVSIIVHDDEEMPIYFVARAWKLAYTHELERLHRSEVRSKTKRTLDKSNYVK
jgi:hypothetical protein